jgi:DNA-binding GntR family transcriptional regulator
VDGQPAVKALARQRMRALESQQFDEASNRSVARPPSLLHVDGSGPPICALTLPQQIADHLGHRIMNGEHPSGSRLKEEHFAELYRVSRGPIREAFRILERRGFVEIVPRHGARVRAFDPADLAALFTVRAVLFGLAARQATENAATELLPSLSEQVARLRRSAVTMDITAREHALIAGDMQRLFARLSGNRPLLRMMEEITSRALWRMAWCETPLDFTTRARRQQSARLWSELLRAVERRDAENAERLARSLLEASRDHMISAMAAMRSNRPPAGDTPVRRVVRRRARNDGRATMVEAN